MRIEFLLEEPSMENVLNEILPKILPKGFILNSNCFLRPHQGKSDLRKSIPNKVRAFSHSPEEVKIVILHDQDSNDCKELKRQIEDLCLQNGHCPVLIRIVCRELESWYLGDMDAIQQIYPRFKANNYKRVAKFRNPDICNASDELKKIIPDFQKGYASREISKHLNIEENQSESFKQFRDGIRKFLNT
ncbi:DUF4276 family protein [Emticicia sp. W12TSBA100-4]|uniref:DUF4276 family protein n=1 Tax=Emticicia sp. W12TSBA100-4 TaxID=3160965 RepID=UPI0033068240